jgi:hypothetical protein
VADGAAHSGVSHWSSGAGVFSLRGRKLLLDNLRLDGAKQAIFVEGSVDFARDTELLIKSTDGESLSGRAAIFGRTLRVSGPLDAPLVTVAADPSRDSARITVP